MCRLALRIRGAVRVALGAMGGNPLCGAREPALHVAQGALKTVSQYVQPRAMHVGGDAIGQGSLSKWLWPSMRAQRAPAGNTALSVTRVFFISCW
jgi:hypothetical protein